MNATIRIKDITPAEATRLLDNQYHKQRKLRDSWVNRLVGEIKRGKFKLSSDAVVIVDGKLLNGQHRLQAVVAADTACQFLVLTTDDPDIYKILDSGAKRSVADVIDVEHRLEISGAASWILQYDRKALTQDSRQGGKKANQVILRSETIEFVDRNRKELQRLANDVALLHKESKLIVESYGIAMAYLANRTAGDDSGSRFVEALYKGTHNSVIGALRNMLTNERLSKKKWKASFRFGLIIKAYNYWRDGKLTDELRFRVGEAYPTFKA